MVIFLFYGLQNYFSTFKNTMNGQTNTSLVIGRKFNIFEIIHMYVFITCLSDHISIHLKRIFLYISVTNITDISIDLIF